jgi:hypothetical protein
MTTAVTAGHRVFARTTSLYRRRVRGGDERSRGGRYGSPGGGVIPTTDERSQELFSVKGGTMAATIAQQPKEMGRLAVEAAVKIINKQRVPKFTPVPLRLVTK